MFLAHGQSHHTSKSKTEAFTQRMIAMIVEMTNKQLNVGADKRTEIPEALQWHIGCAHSRMYVIEVTVYVIDIDGFLVRLEATLAPLALGLDSLLDAVVGMAYAKIILAMFVNNFRSQQACDSTYSSFLSGFCNSFKSARSSNFSSSPELISLSISS